MAAARPQSIGDDPASLELGLTPDGRHAADASGAIEETIRVARRVADLLEAEAIVALRRGAMLDAQPRRGAKSRP